MTQIQHWAGIILASLSQPAGIIALFLLVAAAVVLTALPAIARQFRAAVVLVFLLGTAVLSWQVFEETRKEVTGTLFAWDLASGNCTQANPRRHSEHPGNPAPRPIRMVAEEIEGWSDESSMGHAFAHCTFSWGHQVKQVELQLCGGRTSAPMERGNFLKLIAHKSQPVDDTVGERMQIDGQDELVLGQPGVEIPLPRRTFMISSEKEFSNVTLGIRYHDSWDTQAVSFRICHLDVMVPAPE